MKINTKCVFSLILAISSALALSSCKSNDPEGSVSTARYQKPSRTIKVTDPENMEKGKLYVSTDRIFMGQINSVLFEIKLDPDVVKNGEDILVYSSTPLGQLHDDGQNGDKKADDGVYSLYYEEESAVGDDAGEFNCFVGVSANADVIFKSDEVKMTLFKPLESKDYEEQNRIYSELSKVYEPFLEFGGIPSEKTKDAYEAVAKAAEDMKKEGTVKNVISDPDNYSVRIVLNSGLLCDYQLKPY